MHYCELKAHSFPKVDIAKTVIKQTLRHIQETGVHKICVQITVCILLMDKM